MNPGPLKCSVCDKTIARNHRAVECNACQRRLHIKCAKVKSLEFDRIRAQSVKTWMISPCYLDQLKQLPFANSSNFDTSGSFSDTSDTENDLLFDAWSSFDLLDKNYRAHTKIVLPNSSYSLRGKNMLTLPMPRTTNYGIECKKAAKI